MVDIPLNAKLKFGRVTRRTFINMIELKNVDQVRSVDPKRLYRGRFYKVKSTSGIYLIGDMQKAEFLRPRFIG